MSQLIYNCFTKEKHYDTISYSDFFYTIKNLKVQLIKDKQNEIFFHQPEDKFSKFFLGKLGEIINLFFGMYRLKSMS